MHTCNNKSKRSVDADRQYQTCDGLREEWRTRLDQLQRWLSSKNKTKHTQQESLSNNSSCVHTPPLSPHLSFIILFLIGSAGHTKYEICVVLFLQGADNYQREERSTYTFFFTRPSVGHDCLNFLDAGGSPEVGIYERKQESKKKKKDFLFFLVAFLVESVFSFLFSFFSLSLSWSRGCFLVFFYIFLPQHSL